MQLINTFAIAGYRSFGSHPQCFEGLGKLNVIIGRNNCGKSNVLRFLSEVYPTLGSSPLRPLQGLERHLPDSPTFSVGQAVQIVDVGGTPMISDDHASIAGVTEPTERLRCRALLAKIALKKMEIQDASKCWCFVSSAVLETEEAAWIKAIEVLNDQDLFFLWSRVYRMSQGNRAVHWAPQTRAKFVPAFGPLPVVQIPSVRRIGNPGTAATGLDGSGIIESLARLQNPRIEQQGDRKAFRAIRDFLREVADAPDAELEIPHDRETIHVHIGGKMLPIESLGTGIHEVIILAAAATVRSNEVVCIEEPELHLNPVLQRKLLRYLLEKTDNQYFITTHSAAVMDVTGAEVYHVTLKADASVVERVTSDSRRSVVCEDLGYHPSDLMQANCVVWVEGPSDRLYVNHWIASEAPELVEGIHYAVMFYGGRLAAHVSFELDENAAEDLILLRRLNRRGAILIDSDRTKAGASINATKQRLQEEFDRGPGFCWVTAGREIENYIPKKDIAAALDELCPGSEQAKNTAFASALKVRHMGREFTAPKVAVARHVTQNSPVDLSVLDLREKVKRLVSFVRASNPVDGKARVG